MGMIDEVHVYGVPFGPKQTPERAAVRVFEAEGRWGFGVLAADRRGGCATGSRAEYPTRRCALGAALDAVERYTESPVLREWVASLRAPAMQTELF